MKILYSRKFEKEYRKLPDKIKDIAEKKEKIFRKNPFDRQLKTHKLHGELGEFLVFSINYQYRIVFDFSDEKTARFYSVGGHDLY